MQEIADLKSELCMVRTEKERIEAKCDEATAGLEAERKDAREREKALRGDLQGENDKWRAQIERDREHSGQLQQRLESELQRERLLVWRTRPHFHAPSFAQPVQAKLILSLDFDSSFSL